MTDRRLYVDSMKVKELLREELLRTTNAKEEDVYLEAFTAGKIVGLGFGYKIVRALSEELWK